MIWAYGLKSIWVVSSIGLLSLAIVLAGCAAGVSTTKAKPTYTVSGYVKTPGGTPVSGVRISFGGGSFVFTDSNGHWSKDGLAGSITVMPLKDGIHLHSFESGDRARWHTQVEVQNRMGCGFESSDRGRWHGLRWESKSLPLRDKARWHTQVEVQNRILCVFESSDR